MNLPQDTIYEVPKKIPNFEGYKSHPVGFIYIDISYI